MALELSESAAMRNTDPTITMNSPYFRTEPPSDKLMHVDNQNTNPDIDAPENVQGKILNMLG